MLNRLVNYLFPLSEKEHQQASKCKQKTLNILNDALKKKDSLLVDNPAQFSDQKELCDFPLISTELVKDLINQLKKVTFRRGIFPGIVHTMDGDGIVYLCSQFWKQHELLQLSSRPGTLIHEISRLLGYKNTIRKTIAKMKKSQQHKLCPTSAPNIQSAFSKFMNHSKSYTNDSYACCGETSRDTVCKKSKMSTKLRKLYSRKASLLSKEESALANEAKQRALNILNDALKKKGSLLVDDPDEFGEKKKSVLFPLISTDLVKELISTLQEVTFKRDKHPERETKTIAYVYPTAGDRTVYLCLLFFKQCKFLRKHSRPETLIHEVSHLLGYGHTIEENKKKLKTSQQYKLCPVSVPYIEKAFSLFMNHRRTYMNSSYSCCGETSRDTLCEKSAMAYGLRRMRDELSGHEEPLDHLEQMRNLRKKIDHVTLQCLEMKSRLEEI
ncbi:uncharacterized protein ACMZJ9_021732, partial [Mantella aurantiaca]